MPFRRKLTITNDWCVCTQIFDVNVHQNESLYVQTIKTYLYICVVGDDVLITLYCCGSNSMTEKKERKKNKLTYTIFFIAVFSIILEKCFVVTQSAKAAIYEMNIDCWSWRPNERNRFRIAHIHHVCINNMSTIKIHISICYIHPQCVYVCVAKWCRSPHFNGFFLAFQFVVIHASFFPTHIFECNIRYVQSQQSWICYFLATMMQHLSSNISNLWYRYYYMFLV